ncbi:hypothetical protein KM043_009982 [Ampulex compressa]|nr:hypothetical protein KM043_009982 [Ampulex compressa]
MQSNVLTNEKYYDIPALVGLTYCRVEGYSSLYHIQSHIKQKNNSQGFGWNSERKTVHRVPRKKKSYLVKVSYLAYAVLRTNCTNKKKSVVDSSMNRLPMHDALKSIAWLEGTWISECPGIGKFPTIKPFSYCEEVKFISIGQPMFNYVAQSWHPEAKRPMHRETGFLKVIPGTNKISLILAHNFGLSTIEEGEVNDKTLNLKTTSILRPTAGTKPPAVTKLCREFKLVDNTLQHVLHMATETTPELTEHLNVTYIKESDSTK